MVCQSDCCHAFSKFLHFIAWHLDLLQRQFIPNRFLYVSILVFLLLLSFSHLQFKFNIKTLRFSRVWIMAMDTKVWENNCGFHLLKKKKMILKLVCLCTSHGIGRTIIQSNFIKCCTRKLDLSRLCKEMGDVSNSTFEWKSLRTIKMKILTL